MAASLYMILQVVYTLVGSQEFSLKENWKEKQNFVSWQLTSNQVKTISFGSPQNYFDIACWNLSLIALTAASLAIGCAILI